jgi:ATP-dependent NAD(P)H-hydrate dehydratase
VQQNPSIIEGYSSAILTPNANEFQRICEVLKIGNNSRQRNCQEISQRLGTVILSKGEADIIAGPGSTTVDCQHGSSPRRCGGQGDLLSGSIATFVGWAKQFELSPDKILLSCYGASYLIREASCRAYAVHGRSMVASDIIPHIGPSFNSFFD